MSTIRDKIHLDSRVGGNLPAASLSTDIPVYGPAVVTFPVPGSSWGRVTGYSFAADNPKWRWWTFWRKRYITISGRAAKEILQDQEKSLNPGDLTFKK